MVHLYNHSTQETVPSSRPVVVICKFQAIPTYRKKPLKIHKLVDRLKTQLLLREQKRVDKI